MNNSREHLFECLARHVGRLNISENRKFFDLYSKHHNSDEAGKLRILASNEKQKLVDEARRNEDRDKLESEKALKELKILMERK